MQIMGEVPKFALIDSAAPSDIINKENKYKINFVYFIIIICF
jgi:hypothetical protein